MFFSRILGVGVALINLASAHTVITYPGWRGDNLRENDDYPYGMQWEYPCKPESSTQIPRASTTR